MFYYIDNDSTSPCFNLALEHALFDRLNRRCCMLWRNSNAIIVGRHQITAAEVNQALVDSRGIAVVRRLSGGGAVYHDLGNINFTFITDTGGDINFADFCRPILEALHSFGVPAEFSGRNDMTIEGKKISGNAQYIRENRIMHHGTLLYDSNLDMLSRALIAGAKVESAGIPSVRSRVANIRPFMKTDMPTDQFLASLRDYFLASGSMEIYPLSPEDRAAAQTLCEQMYSQWHWNYGTSPPHNIRKSRRIEGCGTVEIFIEVEKEGIITNASFHGDFFSTDDPAALAAQLTGSRLERKELTALLQNLNLPRYFHNITQESFLSLLFD